LFIDNSYGGMTNKWMYYFGIETGDEVPDDELDTLCHFFKLGNWNKHSFTSDGIWNLEVCTTKSSRGTWN